MMRKCLLCRLLIGLLCVPVAAGDSATKIAFVKGGQVWIGQFGSQPKQLTSDSVPKSLPVWSRDGSMIAFIAQVDPRIALGNLVVLNEQGVELANILVRPADTAPPTGMRFVEYVEWLSNTKLVVGGSINPSTDETLTYDIKSGQIMDDTMDDGGGPVYSPNGLSRAYFGGSPHFAPQDSRAAELNVDEQRVYPSAGKHVDFSTPPRWSADSKQLAVIAEVPIRSGKYKLVVWHSGTGTSKTDLPAKTSPPFSLYWSHGELFVLANGHTWAIATPNGTLSEVTTGPIASDLTTALDDRTKLRAMASQYGGKEGDVWVDDSENPESASADGTLPRGPKSEVGLIEQIQGRVPRSTLSAVEGLSGRPHRTTNNEPLPLITPSCDLRPSTSTPDTCIIFARRGISVPLSIHCSGRGSDGSLTPSWRIESMDAHSIDYIDCITHRAPESLENRP